MSPLKSSKLEAIRFHDDQVPSTRHFRSIRRLDVWLLNKKVPKIAVTGLMLNVLRILRFQGRFLFFFLVVFFDEIFRAMAHD